MGKLSRQEKIRFWDWLVIKVAILVILGWSVLNWRTFFQPPVWIALLQGVVLGSVLMMVDLTAMSEMRTGWGYISQVMVICAVLALLINLFYPVKSVFCILIAASISWQESRILFEAILENKDGNSKKKTLAEK